MKKTGWIFVATLFAVLAAFWLTAGSWFAAKQMDVAHVSPFLGWGIFTLLLGLSAASMYAGCKSPA